MNFNRFIKTIFLVEFIQAMFKALREILGRKKLSIIPSKKDQ